MSDEPHPTDLSRRQLLESALVLPLLSAFRQPGSLPLPTLPDIRKAPCKVIGGDGADAIVVTREWDRTFQWCQSHVTNTSDKPVTIMEVVLFDVRLLPQPQPTQLYGEGFQMLSQTGGTTESPTDVGSYTDAGHYKMPMLDGAHTFYGMMTLSQPTYHGTFHVDGLSDLQGTWILAFTSCRRFSGLFRLRSSTSLQVVVDTEGLTLGPGETWNLEEFSIWIAAPMMERRTLSDRLAVNHPPILPVKPPTGWCSWYCFGPKVTARQVLDNLDVIATKIPGLTYVQIDDGYQPAMGDWLETGTAFGGDVRKVLDEIRKKGFQPAIWVAPFVAEEGSHLFQQHRDWFVKDTDDSPLRSDKVTFGGWRKGPWYVLDGTHPEVHAHFEQVFGTMRREWGVTYFKLDANFWGAIHGGRFHDPKATRVEAYRRGMQAILRGAGDSFILGCNHPIWPSIGLIHGSRSSNDIKRTWDRIKTTAQQNLLRNWQNGTLWWNDPDAIVLTGDLPEQEFLFHATAIYATGGMVLSGDDLTVMPADRVAMLKKLLPPTGVAAIFDNGDLRVGTVTLPNKRMVCLFNPTEAPITLASRLPRPAKVTDFWTGARVEPKDNIITIADMPPHSARLLECVDV